jgi:hypothetical protein
MAGGVICAAVSLSFRDPKPKLSGFCFMDQNFAHQVPGYLKTGPVKERIVQFAHNSTSIGFTILVLYQNGWEKQPQSNIDLDKRDNRYYNID